MNIKKLLKEEIDGMRGLINYMEGKNTILEDTTPTLKDILDRKGTLDHIKNNQTIRLKLIDGPFLDKNPDWRNGSLKFLFYNARENMVGVELIGSGKSGNANPGELVIDLDSSNTR